MPVVLLGRVVPSERADRDDQQQAQPDEHVAAVQAGERVEDRRLGGVVGGEADVDVLVDLDRQERQAEQERRQHSGLQPEAVAVLDRDERPVDRQRRGQQDRGVDAGDRLGELVPAAGHGLWLTIRMKKYAVKNAPKIITSDMMKSSMPSVGAWTREERCAGGGPWCSSWAIEAASIPVLSTGAAVPVGCLLDDVLDRLAGGAAHAIDQIGAQPAGLGLGEGRDHDVVDPEVLQRVDDRGVGVGVADHPRRRTRRPGAGGRAPASGACGPGGWRCPSPPSCGTTTMNRRSRWSEALSSA